MSKQTIICLYCNSPHNVDHKEINRGYGKFCSRNCSSRFRAQSLTPPEANVKCALCNKNFYLSVSKQNNSKSGLFFCCRDHKDKAQRLDGYAAIHPSHYKDGTRAYRKIAFREKPKLCERCGFDKEAALVVHHKDRNRDNNTISNLEVLCANCHAIEHLGDYSMNFISIQNPVAALVSNAFQLPLKQPEYLVNIKMHNAPEIDKIYCFITASGRENNNPRLAGRTPSNERDIRNVLQTVKLTDVSKLPNVQIGWKSIEWLYRGPEMDVVYEVNY